MFIENELYKIGITKFKNSMINKEEEKEFDVVFNPKNYKSSNMATTLCINIATQSTNCRIALVGDCYSTEEDCAVLEDSKLIVLQNGEITVINLLDYTVDFDTHIEDFGCNFKIFKCKKGYVVYGEIYIQMLDFNFNRVWFFSARDILFSTNRKKSFELFEDKMIVYDWFDNCYEIDFDGVVTEK